jgi:DNA-binding MarR family transcriptional regulator
VTDTPASLVARILDDYDVILQCAAGRHVPEFLAIDVTMSQAKVLHLLAAKGRVGMSELAAAMGVALPTMTGVVDRLVEQELVQRLESPDDRRLVLVALTRRGEALLESFREVGRSELRRLLGELDPASLRHLEHGMRALAETAERFQTPLDPSPGCAERSATIERNPA